MLNSVPDSKSWVTEKIKHITSYLHHANDFHALLSGKVAKL